MHVSGHSDHLSRREVSQWDWDGTWSTRSCWRGAAQRSSLGATASRGPGPAYNYRRLHVEIGWLTLDERFDGTPFTDRGFDNVPALAHLTAWLEELRAAA